MSRLIKYFLFTLSAFFVYFLFFKPASVSQDPPPSPAPNSLPPHLTTISTLPTSTLFPSNHLIKTAFIQQAPEKNWDQPWQDACEEAALLTVDFFYKNHQPDLQQTKEAILHLLEFEQQQGLSKDVNINQMAVIASQHLGYSTKIIDNPDLQAIKKYIVDDIPVIIPANGKTLYKENRYFNDSGPYYHNLVILGFNDKKSQFTVHDVGTRHGAYFKYSYQLLMDSIHDFPASLDKKDINTGAKKILILLK